MPLVGDWDGNGTTTVGRLPAGRRAPSSCATRTRPGEPDVVVLFGEQGRRARWSATGTATAPPPSASSGRSDATFLLRNATRPGRPTSRVPFGEKGDVPVVGDWDGNGTATVGVFRAPEATFYLRNATRAARPT